MSSTPPARRRATAAVRVGVGTQFVYDGETVTIIEMFPAGHGNEVLVEDRGGKRRYWLALRELLATEHASIVTDEKGPRSDDDIDTAGVVLASLTAQQLAKVTEQANHVREVLTGYQSGAPAVSRPEEPRQQYAPHLPPGERYVSKARELGVAKRTVQRWVRAYRQHGEAGLVALSRGKPQGRTDDRWVQLAEDVMAENAAMSRPNKKSVIQQTRARLAGQYGPDVVPAPSRATAYRRLNQLDHLVPTFRGSRARNRDVASRPDREYWKLTPARPGEYMVMDTNSLDVYALDPVTLRWVNVEMTVAMDAYTRCIVGVRVTPTTKSLDVAATLFQAYRPPPAPEHWPEHAVWPEHGVPRAVFPEVDALDGVSRGVCNPAIVPETIVVDHGRAFKSQHINSVCAADGYFDPTGTPADRQRQRHRRAVLPDPQTRPAAAPSRIQRPRRVLTRSVSGVGCVPLHRRTRATDPRMDRGGLPQPCPRQPVRPERAWTPPQPGGDVSTRRGTRRVYRSTTGSRFGVRVPATRSADRSATTACRYNNRIYNGPGLNGLRGTRQRLSRGSRPAAGTSTSTPTTSAASSSAAPTPGHRHSLYWRVRQHRICR